MMDKKFVRKASIISSAVMTKALLTIAGFVGGGVIDKALGTDPLFRFGLMIVGISIGLWWLLRVIDR